MDTGHGPDARRSRALTMADQLSWLDQRAARDRALGVVERPSWQPLALGVVRSLAVSGAPFTSDAVWHELDAQGIARPSEPRAMGAVLMYAVRQRWIVKTGRYVTAHDPASRNHARPQAEYRGR